MVPESIHKQNQSNFYWLHKALYVDYFNLTGRANRREFLSVMLLHLVMATIFVTLYYFYFRFESNLYVLSAFYGIIILYGLITFTPTITVHVRRLHDAGKSGWWHPIGVSFISNIVVGFFVIPVVFIYAQVVFLFNKGNAPIQPDIIELIISVFFYGIGIIVNIGILAGIIFLFFDSEKGTNKWGDHPKAHLSKKTMSNDSYKA